MFPAFRIFGRGARKGERLVKTASKGRAAGANRGRAGSGGARKGVGAKSAAPRPEGARGRAASSKQSASRRRFSWSWPELKLGAALRRDIIAVALVVLALLTLWSLFGGRGGLLGLWGEALRRAFGWAAILVPLALLAWTVDAFRQDPVAPFGPRRRHVLGTALLFVAILGLLHLPAPDLLAWGREGKGGGSLGYLVASPLVALLRVPGAALVMLGLATVALVVTLNTDLRSLGRELKGASGKGWRALRRSGAAAKGAIEEGTRTRGGGGTRARTRRAPMPGRGRRPAAMQRNGGRGTRTTAGGR